MEISAEQPPFFEEPVEVTMIGFGRDRVAEQSYWTVTDLGANENVWEEVDGPPFNVAGYKYADTQTKRWGTNIIFTEAVLHGGEPDGLLLFAQFSRDQLVATEFEAQAATGDSGGRVFYKNDGNWELAGVMIFRAEQVHDQPPDTAVFGSQTALVDLSYYRDQIEELTSVKLQPGDANQDFAFDQDVDLFLVESVFQQSTIERRIQVEAGGRKVWIATAEDLVLLKLMAGRPRDKLDVADVLTYYLCGTTNTCLPSLCVGSVVSKSSVMARSVSSSDGLSNRLPS